jgi:hypothetical protein
MRIDEQTLKELADKVEKWDSKLDTIMSGNARNYQKDEQNRTRQHELEKTNNELNIQITQMRTKLTVAK